MQLTEIVSELAFECQRVGKDSKVIVDFYLNTRDYLSSQFPGDDVREFALRRAYDKIYFDD